MYVRDFGGIKYDDISSFNDIYEITKSGFKYDGTSPSLCTMISQSSYKMLTELTVDFMFTNKLSEEEYFNKIGEIEVYDNSSKQEKNNFCFNMNPTWTKVDNQIMREFYIKTLGDYSGYIIDTSTSEVA